MKKNPVNHTKLGLFVLAGLLFLVFLLYMIGRNRSLFSPTYTLKAQFDHVHGLVPGNNVRYAGIEAGTVKRINIINDTLLEVTMIIDKKMAGIIRKNALVSIGTEGFVGNKVVSIIPVRERADPAESGDILMSKKAIDTDAILESLEKTTGDIAEITAGLKQTINRINQSDAIWELLNDASVPLSIRQSVDRIRATAGKSTEVMNDLGEIVERVQSGKGSLGELISDSSFSMELNAATRKVSQVGQKADSLIIRLNDMVVALNTELQDGKGTAHVLLKDSIASANLQESLENIRKGTDAFQQNMEALKHNFLLRGYFRKQERKQKKQP